MTRILPVVFCLICAATSRGGGSGVPGTIAHQGVIAVQGARFTGVGGFRFALCDPANNAYHWTNDGSTAVHPDPPAAAVPLTAVHGVYNVLLGDTSLVNMTAIPGTLFAVHDDLVLRVWFDDNAGHGVHRLTPDLALATAPYAGRSAAADRLIVPGSSETAVMADDDGDVSVASGDLTVEAGDLTVSAGRAVVAGNLTVMGAITNFSIAGPFSAIRTTNGSSQTNLTFADKSFCALTGKQATGVDPNESTGCSVSIVSGRWVLRATLNLGFLNDGSVTCSAHCFVFDDP